MIFRQIKLYHNGKVVRLGQLFGISIYAFYRDMAKKIHFVNPKQLGITPPPPEREIYSRFSSLVLSQGK
ncbi:hypothetical protein [Helicobacter typhlonius]|uniref:hypothetical protein n=1 Tax=Helicobacter typhlonius TaxID=76936 RepID=UPI002FE16E33